MELERAPLYRGKPVWIRGITCGTGEISILCTLIVYSHFGSGRKRFVRRASPHHPYTVFFALSTWKTQLKSQFEARKCEKYNIDIFLTRWKHFLLISQKLYFFWCDTAFPMFWEMYWKNLVPQVYPFFFTFRQKRDRITDTIFWLCTCMLSNLFNIVKMVQSVTLCSLSTLRNSTQNENENFLSHLYCINLIIWIIDIHLVPTWT